MASAEGNDEPTCSRRRFSGGNCSGRRDRLRNRVRWRNLRPGSCPEPHADTPSPSQLTQGDVEPGRYFHEIDGYRYTFTVPESGWTFDAAAGGLSQGDDDTELAIFWPGGDMPELYRRACESTGTEFDPGPSVDDLANALASLEDFESTAPADVTVSGYEGKRVALTVPMDADVDPQPTPTPQAATEANTASRVAAGIRRPARPTTCGSWILTESARPSSSRTLRALRPTSLHQLEAMVASLEIEPR